MWRLAVFPSNGLDRSLHAPILVGLLVVTFFTEAFGWTYAGLVVPGYLAAIASVSPLTCALITGEAIITYLVVASLGVWIPKTNAWSTSFGRERFFLFIVVAVLVRVLVEGWIVPRLVAERSFAQSRELYSVGLVVVPLFANVFWTSGILAAGPRLFVVSGITWAFVELVLLRTTNFSLSRLLVSSESGATEFLASPKAQIIMILGALLGARGNVMYGWDYNGILVPGLLAVAWYEPTKLAATLIEGVVVYVLSVGVTKIPPLSKVLIVGTRRMVVAFTVGFALKMIGGFALSRWAPRVQLADYFGYGYLLPSLLAVKMWNKAKIGIVLMPTIQVSLTAFVAGNALAFTMGFVASAWDTPWTPSRPPDPSDSAGFDLVLGDTVPDTSSGYGLRSSADPMAVVLALADEASSRADLSGATVARATSAGLRVARAGDWITVTPRSADPEADVAGPRVALRVRGGPRGGFVVVARPPSAGSSLPVAAMLVADTIDAAAVVLLSRHGETQRSDRAFAEALIRARDARPFLVESDVSGARLSFVGTIPAKLDVEAVSRALRAHVSVGWRGSTGDAVWKDAPSLALADAVADAAAARSLGAPEVETWTGAARDELEKRMIPLTTVGADGFRGASIEELRLFAATVAPALMRPIDRTGPTEWTRAVASRLHYRFARSGADSMQPEAWIAFEPEGPTRRGQPTIVARSERERRGERLVIEVPAPRWEVGTFHGSIGLFEGLPAQSLLIAGAMPHEDPHGFADVRRPQSRRSFYQVFHEQWHQSGGKSVSVQGIAPDRPAEGDVVLSVGREIPERSGEPGWTAPLREAFEMGGYVVRGFDGSRAQSPFGGGGDPAMAFAERFARDTHAMLWLSPRVRNVLAMTARAEILATRIARTHGIPDGDVAAEVVEMVACDVPGKPPCPTDEQRKVCDLEHASEDWMRFAREGNPFDIEGAATGYGCRVMLMRDVPTSLVWAAVGRRGAARLVPVGLPTTQLTRPIRLREDVRRAMWLNLALVDVRGGPP